MNLIAFALLPSAISQQTQTAANASVTTAPQQLPDVQLTLSPGQLKATAPNYLNRAEKINSGNHLTYLSLGQAYRAAGRKDGATREYRAAEAIQNFDGEQN